jgi:hypothetical protein
LLLPLVLRRFFCYTKKATFAALRPEERLIPQTMRYPPPLSAFDSGDCLAALLRRRTPLEICPAHNERVLNIWNMF